MPSPPLTSAGRWNVRLVNSKKDAKELRNENQEIKLLETKAFPAHSSLSVAKCFISAPFLWFFFSSPSSWPPGSLISTQPKHAIRPGIPSLAQSKERFLQLQLRFPALPASGPVSPFGPTSCKQRAGRDGVVGNRAHQRLGLAAGALWDSFAKKVIWVGKELIGEENVCIPRILL